ncbi:MAG: hypothetical protein K5829_09370 [Treponema sp.]|nr:hypothetical protein [Treponema sp.]
MITFCSYKYNPITQSLENATFNLIPQLLIPFDNVTKQGWCNYHKRWEVVTINSDNKLVFSCGLLLPSNIGLNKCWNKNQYEFLIDTEKLIIRVNEKWSWIDIWEKEIYSTQKTYSKIIDFARGNISYPKNFNLQEIPPEIQKKIMDIALGLCKKKYGVTLHVENASINDFIKYPCCPEFNLIEKKIDSVKNFNFRADLNLFKDFCRLVQVKETKLLRKDFHKNPELLLLHALAQYIGFTNTDATRSFVSDETIYKIFISRNRIRFSIQRRTVYLSLDQKKEADKILKGLRLWVQNARTDKSESVIVKRLIKFFKETNLNVIFDAIVIYYKNARNLPVAFHERILKEGFSNQMHDQLVQYFVAETENNRYGYRSNQKQVSNQKITYDDEVLKFEDFIDTLPELKIKNDYESIKENRLMMLKAEKMQNNNFAFADTNEEIISDDTEAENDDVIIEDIEDIFVYENEDKDSPNGENQEKAAKFEIGKNIITRGPEDAYFFVLPKTTDELYEISTNMRNCVGYLYRDKVLSKSSIIVVLIRKNKMKACIEIIQDKKTFHYVIKQALGPGNAKINRRFFSAIEEWKKKHKIEGEISYEL